MLKHVSHFSSNLNVFVVLLTALTVGEIKLFLYAVSLFFIGNWIADSKAVSQTGADYSFII